MTTGPEATTGSRAPGLDRSHYSRLIDSGLLAKANAALGKRLCQTPGDSPLWSRRGDTQRSLGDLAASATCYARAALINRDAAEAEAMAALVGGDPVPSASRSEGRAVPFLVRSAPLSRDLTEAIRAVRDDGAGGATPALVGKKKLHDPSIRDAVTIKLPDQLLTVVLRAMQPFADGAARQLFPNPVTLGEASHNLVDYALGGGYRAHRDAGGPRSPTWRRALTIVLYIDIAEASFTGGDLLLFDRRGNTVTRFRPASGMAIAFPSDSWHEVTRLEIGERTMPPRRTVMTFWYDRAEPDQR